MGLVSMEKQLFEAVAIDPAMTKSKLVCMILKHKFGLVNGRFIAGIPRDWNNFALQAVNTLSDENLKRKLKEVLYGLTKNGAMVPESVAFDRSKSWAQAALSSNIVKQSVKVLITDESVQFEPTFSSENIDDYIEESEGRIGYLDVSTLRSGKDFIPFLAPFLKKHKKIVLVNRHQWLLSTRKVRDLFETVFQYWILQGGVDFTVIRSSVEKRDDPLPFSTNWRNETELLRKYLNRVQFGGTFRFVAVNDERNRLHHRYLLGNYCGLSMDYGFEIVSKPHPWQLLNRAHFLDAKEKFFIGDVLATYPECRVFSYSQQGKRVTQD